MAVGFRPAPDTPAPVAEVSTPTPAIDPATVFPGSWTCPDTTAVWSLSVHGAAMLVTGVDSGDDEVFEVSDVSWDGGSVLRFTARMPSTDWTVTSTLRVLDRNRLKVERDGNLPWSCVATRSAWSPSDRPPSTAGASPPSSSR